VRQALVVDLARDLGKRAKRQTALGHERLQRLPEGLLVMRHRRELTRRLPAIRLRAVIS